MAFILLSPVLLFIVKKPGAFFSNCISVLSGRRTWIGYSHVQPYLPPVRRGILPPYNIIAGYQPDEDAAEKLDILYAQDYTSDTDMRLILKNLKYLGGF